MAITIDGTGSISGISAGGLPDASVTADDIAAGAVTAAKLAAGVVKVIKSEVLTSSTRTALSTTAANTTRVTLLSWNYDKISNTSNLLFFGNFIGHDNSSSGHVTPITSYGGTEIVGGWHYQYANTLYSTAVPIGGAIIGHTTTGTQTLAFQYYNANSTSGGKPFEIVNPNSTDDARLAQTTSIVVVLEVEP